MILVRTTRLDETVEDFADRLEAASGDRAVMLVDERRGPAGPSRRATLGITVEGCRALGLHTPADFAWRCGDYGLYLARDRYPDERWYWLIEYDVRITGNAALFFQACAARPETDMLAAHLRPTGPDWWWYATVTSRDARPYRCFFPVIRLTGRAIDRLAARRRAHARRPLRLALWPNDESFVATEIASGGLSHLDFNALGQPFYDDATFSYNGVIRGEDFVPTDGPPRLCHPVLFGEDYGRKLRRIEEDHGRPTPLAERAYRKLISRLNALTRW